VLAAGALWKVAGELHLEALREILRAWEETAVLPPWPMGWPQPRSAVNEALRVLAEIGAGARDTAPLLDQMSAALGPCPLRRSVEETLAKIR
jgi:hypothetical protein